MKTSTLNLDKVIEFQSKGFILTFVNLAKMKTIKLICSDIDGTLLNTERDLSEHTISTLNKLKKTLPIVLISARMPSAMQHLQKQIGIEHYPLVAYNGGLIYADGKIVDSTTIPYKLVDSIVKCNTDDLHLSLYNGDDWYVPQHDKWTEREVNNTKVDAILKPNNEVLKLWKTTSMGAHKIMCMGEQDKVSAFYETLSDNFSDKLHLYRSKDTYIEIAPKVISKRSAIEFLIQTTYKFTMEEVMSFGDNYNDIEMLEASGLGLAVGNANEEVKKVAKRIIGNAKQDGVAHFLNDYFKI